MGRNKTSRMTELESIIKADVAQKLKERKEKEEKELEEYNKRLMKR